MVGWEGVASGKSGGSVFRGGEVSVLLGEVLHRCFEFRLALLVCDLGIALDALHISAVLLILGKACGFISTASFRWWSGGYPNNKNIDRWQKLSN